MAEFDIKKVITVKDYFIDPNCVEKGKRYYFADTLERLESYVKKESSYFSGEYNGNAKTGQDKIEGLIIDNESWQYLYPYEETPKKYRPFKCAELLGVLGRAVGPKEDPLDSQCKMISLVTTVDIMDEEDCVCVNSFWYSAEEFLEKFEFYNIDGSITPCGVLKEENPYADLC